MNILITTAITSTGIAAQIISYCQQANPSLAIGGGIPWLYPEIPPPVNIYMTELPATIGSFPVTRIIPVVPSDSGLISTAEGELWEQLPLNLNILRDRSCKHVLIEANIVHNLLPPSVKYYESTGLYFNGTPHAPGFTVGQPTGFLDVVQQIGVLPKVPDAIHVVQILREV